MTKGQRGSMVILPFDEEGAERLIEEHASDLAVVMIEPVLGPGRLPAGKSLLQRLRDVTRRSGVLLLFDEIITGFRLALGGGQEYFGVVPGLAIYGKALGGGTPIGAIGCSREMLEKTARLDPPLSVAGTFSGNSMTIASSIAMLDSLMANPQIYHDLQEKGDYLRTNLNAFAQAKGLPATMTSAGSMFQTHLVPPPVVKPRDRPGEDHEAVESSHCACG